METLKWVLIGISVPVIGWLVVRTRKNAQALGAKIDEYHREQEEQEKQSQGKKGPINPYDQMAELFAPQEKDKKDQ